jgi:hypothetical protein
MRSHPTKEAYLYRAIAALQDDLSKPWNTYPCLDWPFSVNSNGYGTLWFEGRSTVAHRKAWELHTGKPLSRKLSNHCGNSGCFRPIHHFTWVTKLEYLKSVLGGLTDDLSLPWNIYPCLEWPFMCFGNGYGRIQEDRALLAHREAFRIANGTFDDTLMILHHCDNPPCFRPIHLFKGTCLDNVHDMIAKGRARHTEPRLSIRGEAHHNAKYTWAIVEKMRAMYARGIKPSVIADTLGYPRPTVHRMVTNGSWVR